MTNTLDQYVDAYKRYLDAIENLEKATAEAFPRGCRVIFTSGKRPVIGVCHGPGTKPGYIIAIEEATGRHYTPNPYRDGTVGLLCEAFKNTTTQENA